MAYYVKMIDERLALASLLLCLVPFCSVKAADSFNATSQPAGPTPFLAGLSGNYTGTVQSVSFTIAPRSNSYTRPLHATYSAAYLTNTGNLTATTLNIPIFGLYSNYQNNVTISVLFSDGVSVIKSYGVITSLAATAYSDPCPAINMPSFNQYRSSTDDLPYDFFLLKDACSSNSPAIVDTDGIVRWVGTANTATSAAILNGNTIYASDNGSGINSIAIESGKVTHLADFAPYGVTTTWKHNIDPGRNGTMLVEVDTQYTLESSLLEFDVSGKVLNQWFFGDIISRAIGNGSSINFVAPNGQDWFHLNSATYNSSDNTLIASSRESGVFDVDYDPPPGQTSGQKLHWVLGDNTKAWYQYLSSYALNLGSTNNNNLFAPIGQHAVSIDSSGNLLLMNDGLQSSFQSPPGENRTDSYTTEYTISSYLRTASATNLFVTYSPTASSTVAYSAICGSSYEFRKAYLIDFANEVAYGAPSGTPTVVDIIGIGPLNGGQAKEVFRINYPNKSVNGLSPNCSSGFNAVPLDLSNMNFP